MTLAPAFKPGIWRPQRSGVFLCIGVPAGTIEVRGHAPKHAFGQAEVRYVQSSLRDSTTKTNGRYCSGLPVPWLESRGQSQTPLAGLNGKKKRAALWRPVGPQVLCCVRDVAGRPGGAA
jgi:hypothetical protein